MQSDAEEFAGFVAEHGDGLLRFARSLTADPHRAEDLVQSALTRTFARWPSVRRRDPLAYVRRAVVNGRISGWRKRSSREVLGAVAEAAAVDRFEDGVADRLRVRDALDRLPRRQRIVIVLRYLHDVSDEDIARVLHTRETTVRSQAHRGLARLRDDLERDPDQSWRGRRRAGRAESAGRQAADAFVAEIPLGD